MTETRVAVTKPQPVLLDGATLTPRKLALIAREGAVAQLADDARGRNDEARVAVAAILERGGQLYGVTTGVGALRDYRIPDGLREQYSLSLLRSHACGAGRPLPAQMVRPRDGERIFLVDEEAAALLGAWSSATAPRLAPEGGR